MGEEEVAVRLNLFSRTASGVSRADLPLTMQRLVKALQQVGLKGDEPRRNFIGNS